MDYLADNFLPFLQVISISTDWLLNLAYEPDLAGCRTCAM